MPEVVWFFDRLFLPRRLDFGDVAAVPLRVQVDSLGAALGAHLGPRRDTRGIGDSPVMDMAALVFRDGVGDDPVEAIASTSARARAVASALGFRQMGRGSFLGVAVEANASYVLRRAAPGYKQVTNLAFVPEEQEVGAVIQAFADHPQAMVLADLFAEGCRDEDPSAGVARLWAVLEALAERFRGTKLAKVRDLLSQLEVNDGDFEGGPLIDRAYLVRNNLMHRGLLAPIETAERLRADLAHLTSFTLRRAGLAPVAPASKRVVSPPPGPTR